MLTLKYKYSSESVKYYPNKKLNDYLDTPDVLCFVEGSCYLPDTYLHVIVDRFTNGGSEDISVDVTNLKFYKSVDDRLLFIPDILEFGCLESNADLFSCLDGYVRLIIQRHGKEKLPIELSIEETEYICNNYGFSFVDDYFFENAINVFKFHKEGILDLFRYGCTIPAYKRLREM